ncbi:HAD family hydrolase [uncultured Sphingomonas sp.]|uniref:HAD family hydrolase n=1 Tax=uncultured Sphingomonas sp. TaxID=158754 RepID=UPI0035CA0561
MTGRSPKAVLFDLDGTLVDSNEAHVDVWVRVFREAGHPIAAEVIRGQIGKGGDQLVPDLLPDLPAAAREQLAERHGALFKADWLDRIRPFPAARDLLARVRRGRAKLVFASSASQAELDHYIELLDARALVNADTSIDDVKASKPAGDIFAVALEKAGVAPGDALAVGDTPYDIEAARKAGVATVAVRSGGFSDDALAGALAIYDHVAALLEGFDQSPLGST